MRWSKENPGETPTNELSVERESSQFPHKEGMYGRHWSIAVLRRL